MCGRCCPLSEASAKRSESTVTSPSVTCAGRGPRRFGEGGGEGPRGSKREGHRNNGMADQEVSRKCLRGRRTVSAETKPDREPEPYWMANSVPFLANVEDDLESYLWCSCTGRGEGGGAGERRSCAVREVRAPRAAVRGVLACGNVMAGRERRGTGKSPPCTRCCSTSSSWTGPTGSTSLCRRRPQTAAAACRSRSGRSTARPGSR